MHGHNRRWSGCALIGMIGVGFTSGGANAQYRVTNLVSDGSVGAANHDGNLVNGWGVAFNPQGVAWVADNGTGLSTLYDGNGVPQSLVVSIPSPDPQMPGAPTGIVFSGGNGFTVTANGASGPARFMWSTEDGTIAAWNPNVDLHHAFIVAPPMLGDAIYKGIALATTTGGDRIYATDFHNGRVDVYDESFAPVTIAGAFTDANLPRGFAPFGIQAIGDRIIVTYAKQDADREDEIAGPGLGFVDAYDAEGRLLSRIASRGKLNAPWGVALAPRNFGEHSGELLIGNFGDGRINAFSREEHGHEGHGHENHEAWRWAGALHGRRGGPIRIDGLWGMQFGNGVGNQQTNTLFFAAGPHDESGGVYGRIDADPRH